jgi:DNA gyrase subunit A
MAARRVEKTDSGAAFDSAGATVIASPLSDEVETSFLEYAYSVIHSRALPDARDGLKPVHRRILFSMSEANVRPDRPHVKSARIVGDCMGRLHPHGDSAIYDAMVRMAQDFSLNTPLVDGHGNFGSPDDPAAASRYTEARMSQVAMFMVGELDERTVDMAPNYDGSLQEPVVLPAAFPNLLVNGSSGIAVGMATNMIPHNLAEVTEAARHLLRHPNASLDKLMEFVPGPDLPTGGLLLGLDAVRSAYETGKGIVRLRARTEVGPLPGSRGKSAITVTELPYQVGAEKVIAAIKDEIGKKRLTGIADVKDLTDRTHGTRLVVEVKAGVNPQALLADLFRLTPLETSFGITNLALVNGQPRTLGLKDLLRVFVDHRLDVVTRRTQFRLDKAEARAHIVEGLLIALDNIDRVVKIIRGSKDSATAKASLIKTFKLSDIQAQHILDMPLRRLTSLEVDALRAEFADLQATIAGLREILDDEKVLHKVVFDELGRVIKDLGAPRRTTLVDGDLKELVAAPASAAPLEIADEPCQVLLSSTGLLARTAVGSEEAAEGRRKNGRAKHDVVVSQADTTSRGQVLLVTSLGRAFRVDVLDFPALPNAAGTVTLRGGMPVRDVIGLEHGETVVAVAPAIAPDGSLGLALGTSWGKVKICAPDWPVRSDEFTVIGLDDGDEVIGATWLPEADRDLVFVTSEANLLRFPAGKVRPQGRSGGGMAGVALPLGASAVFFGAARDTDPVTGDTMVVTSTGGGVKVTPLSVYPAKGRATGGVRCQRFLKGESKLVVAWVGTRPAGATDRGEPVGLPEVDPRRDGSGTSVVGPDVVGHLVER